MDELRIYQIEKARRLDRVLSTLSLVLFLTAVVILSAAWNLPRREWLVLAIPIGGTFILDLFRLSLFVHWHLLRWPQALIVWAAFLPILIGMVAVYFLPWLFWNTWLWVGMIPFFLLYAGCRWQFIDRKIRVSSRSEGRSPS
ncbi:MAG: hypothetical protein WCP58_10315 [bacterium]